MSIFPYIHMTRRSRNLLHITRGLEIWPIIPESDALKKKKKSLLLSVLALPSLIVSTLIAVVTFQHSLNRKLQCVL